MYSESTVRPVLVERYPSLVRINYGVVEVKREGMEGEEPMTFYEYQMLELEDTNIVFDELLSLLVNDRYPLQEQVEILTGTSSTDINGLNAWRSLCKKVAREVLAIPVTLESAREDKTAEIDQYDVSDNVNIFFYQGVPMWLSLEERKNMRQSIEACKQEGKDTIIYWKGLVKFEFPTELFEVLLNKLEVYALDCFNVTASHKATVSTLQSIEEVEAYDYTTNYPEKLMF